MDDGTPGSRCCEICGKPLYRNNKVGVCADKKSPACRREREIRERRAKGIPPRKRNECRLPGCHRARKRDGLCTMHYARFARTGEYGPNESIQKIVEVHAGETFSWWTVLEDCSRTDAFVLCRCECGTEKPVKIALLVYDRSLSCGCRHRQRPRGSYMDAGEVFGRLTTLEGAVFAADMIRVRCECGIETTKQARLLRIGNTRSCGCGRGKWTHGLSQHPLYGTWNGMWDRCTNPAATGYGGYGACGIRPCAGWQGAPDGLLNFIADMGDRPEGMTLDRREPEGGYWCGRCAECVSLGRPANCRWATKEQQSRNKRIVGKVVQQRNAALAEVERLNRLLEPTPRKRNSRTIALAQDALF